MGLLARAEFACGHAPPHSNTPPPPHLPRIPPTAGKGSYASQFSIHKCNPAILQTPWLYALWYEPQTSLHLQNSPAIAIWKGTWTSLANPSSTASLLQVNVCL